MSLPYFNLYPKDFEAKTSHLTLEEDGAYNRLLRILWMAPNCEIPNDDQWIMRRLRVDQETYERVVVPVINEFFERSKQCLSNARLTEVFLASKEAHEKRVLAGKKGGISKSLKSNNKVSSNAKAMPKQPEPEPKPDNTTLPDARAMCAALGITDETKSIGLLSLSDPIYWISSGCDMEMDILPTLRQIGARGKVVTSWAYCSRAVFEARDKRLAPSPQVTAPISKPAFSKSKSVASLAIENAMRSSNG